MEEQNSPQPSQPVQNQPVVYPPANDNDRKKKLIIIGGGVLVAIILVVVFILVLRRGGSDVEQSGPAQIPMGEDVEGTSMQMLHEEDVEMIEPAPVDPFPHDKDRDGISDQEEVELGTSDLSFDTDQDGLSDRLEIEVWGTDPTNADTDGDGFGDGSEVIRGFNPNGEGELDLEAIHSSQMPTETESTETEEDTSNS